MENKEDRIIKIIEEINPFDDFDTNTELLEEGILDSLTSMLLLDRMEETFDIEVPEEDIKKENFETVETLANMIDKLK